MTSSEDPEPSLETGVLRSEDAVTITEDPTPPPWDHDDDELLTLADKDPRQIVALAEHTVEDLSGNPDSWPLLAGWLQWIGSRMTRQGAHLSQRLAAYTAKHPHITVPADGPACVTISPGEHAGVWDQISDWVTPRPGDPAAYGAVIFDRYGRTNLGYRAESIPGPDTDAMLVLFFLTEEPQQYVRALIGGVDPNNPADTQALHDTLAARGIDMSPMPRFWLPPQPHTEHVIHGDTEDDQRTQFDIFGRCLGEAHDDDLVRFTRNPDVYVSAVRDSIALLIPGQSPGIHIARYTEPDDTSLWLLTVPSPVDAITVDVAWSPDSSWSLRLEHPDVSHCALNDAFAEPESVAEWIITELSKPRSSSD